jgi:Protein of unknown function, DUF547
MRHLIFLSIALFIAACSNAPEPKKAVSEELPQAEAPATKSPAPAVEAPVAPSTDAAAQPQTPAATKPAKKQVATSPKKSTPMPAKKPVIVREKWPEEAATTVEMPEESLVPVPAIQKAPAPPPLNHEAFEQLLQKHVDDTGKVNYKGLKSDKAALDAYCQLLTDNPPQEGCSRSEALAYWINAYNAYTLKLMVDNYPTQSITKLDGGKTWDVRRIKIGSSKYSLNNIENDIIRPKFQEPRIHFAVNCAAKSCPPLWNHAYTAENLETALESRARAFINNSSYNTLAGNRARVSKIFDWYGTDFGDLRVYLNKYADNPLDANASIRFNEYDWDLND